MRALGRPQKGFDLASERGIIHFHLNGRDDPDISWNLFSTDNLHDISSDQLLRRDLGEFALTHALGSGGKHVLEAFHECFGLGLLQEGDDSGDEDDDDEDESEIEVGKVACRLHDIGDDAENGADPQQNGEPVGDFLEEANPAWRFFLLRQFVVALFLVPSQGSSSGHSRFDVGAESAEQFLEGDFVLVHALDFVCLFIHLALLEFLLILGEF